jgi:hypothetical protein
VRKTDGKRPLGRPRHIWQGDNKMDHHEKVGWGMDWIDLAKDMDKWQNLVKTVMNLHIP